MFDKNLKFLREKYGMEQMELADRLGRKSSSSISEWEKGKYTPKIKTLAQIANIFKVDLDDLMNKDLTKEVTKKDINVIYNQLTEPRQQNVYYFAEYQLEEQQKELQENNVHYLYHYGAVSAGSGEMLQDEHKEEIKYTGDVPQHDFTLTINGSSMEPMFQDGEIIFVKETKEARIGQIVIAAVNGEGFVKKLGRDRLISLNSEYDDIHIKENDRAEIIGVVVL